MYRQSVKNEYYTLNQTRVYRVYQGGVYPDTADDPCPAALVAGYSDTPRYTGMYRYSYTADTRYIPIQHPSGQNTFEFLHSGGLSRRLQNEFPATQLCPCTRRAPPVDFPYVAHSGF
jgi:hypothetical protein